jgi:hypothetical protein
MATVAANTTSKSGDNPRVPYVTLTLVPLRNPGRWPAAPMRRLAAALKCLFRGYGWKCVSYGGELGDQLRNELREDA